MFLDIKNTIGITSWFIVQTESTESYQFCLFHYYVDPALCSIFGMFLKIKLFFLVFRHKYRI